MRGAGAVRVARDELLPLLAFVVHRVAQSARDRNQEGNERDAEDEDAATEVEALTSRDLWEQSISLGAVVRFVVCLVTFFTSFKRRGGGRERRVVVREGARPGVAGLRQSVRSSVEFAVGTGVDVSSVGR